MAAIAIDGYRHIIALRVRFADLDVNGHVNHARYLSYLEHGRIHYTTEVVGVPFTMQAGRPQTRMIMASIQVDYLRPALFDQEIIVYTRTTRLGNKSLQKEQILLADGQRATAALSTIVAFDYGAGRSVRVPDEWRRRIREYEPTPPAG